MEAAIKSWNKNWKECLVIEQAYNENIIYIFFKSLVDYADFQMILIKLWMFWFVIQTKYLKLFWFRIRNQNTKLVFGILLCRS